MFKRHGDFQRFDNKIWLSTPTFYADELEFVKDAVEENSMTYSGRNISSVEETILKMTKRKYAVSVSSGTAALHLAVKLAGVKKGDRVFCSDLTFSATANVIMYEGAIPVFIDSEADTWNMSPQALEKAFEKYPEVRVIVLAHLFGIPAKIDEIKKIAKRHGAFIVEDAAEVFGAKYKGDTLAKHGDASCLSFNKNKIITGTGGGMLLTDNEKDAEKARKWSVQSREKAPWYEHTEIGYNYAVSNITAGIIRGQLPHLEEHIAKKKAIYERYKVGFSDLPVLMNPFDEENSAPNFWLSCITVDKNAMCRQIRSETEALFKAESQKTCPTEILQALQLINAEGRPIWKPMHLQPVFSGCDFVTASNLPDGTGADVFERGLCLPSDIKITKSQQDKIIEAVRACLD